MLARLIPFYTILLLNVTAISLAVHDKLLFYIHPRYISFVVIMSAISGILCTVGIAQELWQFARRHVLRKEPILLQFPFSFKQLLFSVPVIIVILAFFTVRPQPVTSTAAGQASLTQGSTSLGLDPSQDSPVEEIDTTKYNIADWAVGVRGSDPSMYLGKPVDVVGFVHTEKKQPPGTYLLARNTISCCAADSRLFGLLVKGKPPGPENTWVRAKGKITREPFGSELKAILVLSSAKMVPQPKDPYIY